MVSLFIGFGVVRHGYGVVFLAGNHGRGPGMLDLGAHVARVVGPVGQHCLARTQVTLQQARGLRVVASLAPSQGQGTNPALRIAMPVELGGKTAAATAERLADGAVFFFTPAATWSARPAVESTTSRCNPVVLCTWASTCGHTPACRQRRNRAHTVCQKPKRSTGKSRHETPHRTRQRTASTNKRASLAVVPSDCSWAGSSGASCTHCAAVSMLRSLLMLKGRP